MKHKHAELIHAWADGAEIQIFSKLFKEWRFISEPDWNKDYQFRIKPEPMRELSDEEVDKILKQHDWYNKSWVDMVRSIESAILKKAREK